MLQYLIHAASLNNGKVSAKKTTAAHYYVRMLGCGNTNRAEAASVN